MKCWRKVVTNSEVDVGAERLRKHFWKNVLVVGAAFLFLFTGYQPVSAIQSSLNGSEGVGVVSLSAKYAAMAFGNLFTNNYVVDRVGCKWSMSLGMFLYSTYIAANFYPTFETLVPFGVLSGVGGAAMWMAQGTYLTRICTGFVALRTELSERDRAVELERLKARTFAIFYGFHLTSAGLGNLASSLILPPQVKNGTGSRLGHCGAAYCNEDLDHLDSGNRTETVPQVDNVHVYWLCGFCLASALLGVALLVFVLDRLPVLGVSEDVSDSGSVFGLVLATVRHWKHPYQLLLIPICLYNGMDSVFWSAEYSKAFVTCSVGVHFVGYVMVCYGFSAAFFLFVFRWFVRKKSTLRLVPFLVGLVAQLSVLAAILSWKPQVVGGGGGELLTILFVMSVVWGIGSGVWYPLTSAFVSVVFGAQNVEAAFSNFHLWNNVGSAVSYAWSYELCVSTKAILLMCIVCVGVSCHLMVELHRLRTAKNSVEIEPNVNKK